jgi:hypothetical protein
MLLTRLIQRLQIRNNQLLLILKSKLHQLMLKVVVIKKMKVNGLHKVVNRSIIVIEIKEKMKHQIKNYRHLYHQIVKLNQKKEQHLIAILYHQQIKMKLMLNQQKHQMFLFHHHQKFKNQLKFVNYYHQVKIVILLMIIGGNKH